MPTISLFIATKLKEKLHIKAARASSVEVATAYPTAYAHRLGPKLDFILNAAGELLGQGEFSPATTTRTF
ncbi:hypothetical protein GCM10022265_39880 [Marinobacter xestospongiae]